jgi:hypothetical protein
VRPQSAKQKGRKLQQLVRDLILDTFPSLGKDDVRSTSMGNSGEDVQLSPAARKLVPYQIECKSKATSYIHTVYEQAKAHGEHEPLVIIKKNRGDVLAVVSLEHYMRLLKQLNASS